LQNTTSGVIKAFYRNSSVSVVTGYRLDDRVSVSGSVFVYGHQVLLPVQWVPRSPFVIAKLPDLELDHSTTCNVMQNLRMRGALRLLPHTYAYHLYLLISRYETCTVIQREEHGVRKRCWRGFYLREKKQQKNWEKYIRRSLALLQTERRGQIG